VKLHRKPIFRRKWALKMGSLLSPVIRFLSNSILILCKTTAILILDAWLGKGSINLP